MNDDIFGGMWKQLKGSIKQKWGELTDDDIQQIEGKRDNLVGKLQERYGWTKAQADAELDRYLQAAQMEQKNYRS